jgi:DNA-binding PadR family transcriptional regulator
MPAKPGRQHRHLPAFILLTLAHESRHGGAIHTALSQRLEGFNTDSGAIYRTLRALEEQGAIASTWDTPRTGPARKVYQITPAGWIQLQALAEDIRYRLGLLQTFLTSYEDLMASRNG